MNFCVCFLVLLVLIQTASCVFEPWEHIKKWYGHIDYDKVKAEARHAESEDTCLSLTGTKDGVCYEECMFRIYYHLIDVGTISVNNPDSGLNGLECRMLHLQDACWFERSKNNIPSTNLPLLNSLRSCRTDGKTWGLWDAAGSRADFDDVCPTMKGEEKATVIVIMNCLKQKLKDGPPNKK